MTWTANTRINEAECFWLIREVGTLERMQPTTYPYPDLRDSGLIITAVTTDKGEITLNLANLPYLSVISGLDYIPEDERGELTKAVAVTFTDGSTITHLNVELDEPDEHVLSISKEHPLGVAEFIYYPMSRVVCYREF